MSKISLEGNVSGSGTLTIAAPNTNSNFTLTLPTETGTIITNSGNQAGSFTTLNTSGAVVFNDAGADVDFRVESDTDANAFFLDGATGDVSIGQNLKFNSGYGSVATAYGCRAWVNFDGTGTVAIRESGNVSSITDNGTGDYTVNFTTAMPDANYAAIGSGGRNNNGPTLNVPRSGSTPSTSAISVLYSTLSLEYDVAQVNIAIFR